VLVSGSAILPLLCFALLAFVFLADELPWRLLKS
jgi:hypothetical protein